MKKPDNLLLHLSFWSLFGLILYAITGVMFMSIRSGNSAIEVNKTIFWVSTIVVVSVLVIYIFYFLTPLFTNSKKRFYFFVAFILVIAIVYILNTKHINNNLSYLLDTIGFFVLPLIFIFSAFVIRTIISLWKENTTKTELEKEKLFAQLELLKAKIDPHFLFNSLNNIDVLIQENPKIASEYLTRLSDILRYILYETKGDNISLSKELEQIKSYVELQKIRTDNARFVNLSIRGELSEQKIAPMIFIPFVENAFKHCKNKSIENAISIDFDIHPQVIRMTCKNYYDSNHLEILKNGGLGIETMKQRLNLLYPKNHKLVIEKTEQWFSVTLTIKLKNDNKLHNS